jgi:hypothetical protein
VKPHLEYLKHLDQSTYSTFNVAQKMSVINDIAESVDLHPVAHNNVFWTYNDPKDSANPRRPYIVTYCNAARVLDNNQDIMNNKYLADWYDPIEFEAGFKMPSDEWYAQHEHRQLGHPHLKAIEIHQPSINCDPDDLASVKRLFDMWSKVISYDWIGKLIDPGVNGL